MLGEVTQSKSAFVSLSLSLSFSTSFLSHYSTTSTTPFSRTPSLNEKGERRRGHMSAAITLALEGRRSEALAALPRQVPTGNHLDKFLSVVVDAASRLGEVFLGGDDSMELLHLVVARDFLGETRKEINLGTCAFLLRPGEADGPDECLLESRGDGALSLLLAFAQWRPTAPVVARLDDRFEVLRLLAEPPAASEPSAASEPPTAGEPLTLAALSRATRGARVVVPCQQGKEYACRGSGAQVPAH